MGFNIMRVLSCLRPGDSDLVMNDLVTAAHVDSFYCRIDIKSKMEKDQVTLLDLSRVRTAAVVMVSVAFIIIVPSLLLRTIDSIHVIMIYIFDIVGSFYLIVMAILFFFSGGRVWYIAAKLQKEFSHGGGSLPELIQVLTEELGSSLTTSFFVGHANSFRWQYWCCPVCAD